MVGTEIPVQSAELQRAFRCWTGRMVQNPEFMVEQPTAQRYDVGCFWPRGPEHFSGFCAPILTHTQSVYADGDAPKWSPGWQILGIGPSRFDIGRSAHFCMFFLWATGVAGLMGIFSGKHLLVGLFRSETQVLPRFTFILFNQFWGFQFELKFPELVYGKLYRHCL